MSGLRLAFVTRRFWPLVGDSELTIASLAAELLHRGHRPIVLTPKYARQWPGECCVREVPVVRLPHPQPKTWGNVRYAFAVSRWIQQRLKELDAVIVSGSREDALTVLGSVRSSPVAVLFHEEFGLASGDQPNRVFGDSLMKRLATCDAWVRLTGATSFATDDLPAGLPADRVHRLPLGVEVPAARGQTSQASARQASGEVNHDLQLAASAPAVLCLAPLVREGAFDQLARSWRVVQNRWPEARLWIVGDGPYRGPLFELLSDLNLRYRIVLPGSFDDWDTLLQAVDLVVQPDAKPHAGLAVVQAMAAGLPVIVFNAEGPSSAESLSGTFPQSEAEPPLIVVSRNEGDRLTAVLNQLLDQPAERVRLGELGREYVARHHSLSSMVDGYERLLQSLVEQRRPPIEPA